MTIPAILPGTAPEAALWNTLFEELDRKVDVAMDGHPFNYLNIQNPRDVQLWDRENEDAVSQAKLPIVGSMFVFCGANRHATAGINRPNYDHAFFTNLANTLSVLRTDHTNKFVQLASASGANYTTAGLSSTEDDIFSASLEAHRRDTTTPLSTVEKYWVVGGTGGKWAQHYYDWALADIFFEDFGATFTVEKNYNKYHFFRFNNCQGVSITITFKDTLNNDVFSLTVPKYSCRCVRRSSVDEGYLLGFKYFNRFVPGDFRFTDLGVNAYVAGHPEDTSNFINDDVYLSMFANNVVNPFIAHAVNRIFRDRYYSDQCAGWTHDPAMFGTALRCSRTFLLTRPSVRASASIQWFTAASCGRFRRATLTRTTSKSPSSFTTGLIRSFLILRPPG
jgi:hypothetical protein